MTVEPRAERRGSQASDSQIYAAVRYGRSVSVVVPDKGLIYGLVMGMDDYHWVITDGQDVHLVHKSNPCLTITDRTLGHHPRRESIESMVAPFRSKVMRDVYQIKPSS